MSKVRTSTLINRIRAASSSYLIDAEGKVYHTLDSKKFVLDSRGSRQAIIRLAYRLGLIKQHEIPVYEYEIASYEVDAPELGISNT